MVQDVQQQVNDEVALHIGRLTIDNLTYKAHLAILQSKVSEKQDIPKKVPTKDSK